MGAIIRIFSVLNGAREWLTFGGEAMSWLGITKRVAAVAAGAAVIAAPVAIMTKPAATYEQLEQARAQVLGKADGDGDSVAPALKKISAKNIYSELYLIQKENRQLLDAIIEKCKTTNEMPAAQCSIAASAESEVLSDEREAKMIAAFRRVQAEEAAKREAGAGKLKLPHEFVLVK